MKILRSRKFQIVAVSILLFIVAIVSADRFSEVNIVRNIVTAPVTFAQKTVISISEAVTSFFSGIKEYNKLLEENNDLKKEIAQANKKINDLKKHEVENLRLRSALLLKEKFSNYEVIGGNVLGSSSDSFSFEFRIDTGLMSGIRIDDPVVSEENFLIGRIYITGVNSASVITIMDEKSGISGWISKEDGGHVVVRGDIRYKDENYCLIEKIPYDVEIKAGDIVETSGLGGIYPKGITIGEVVEVYKEENRLERYALLKPYVNFNTIKEVYVLREIIRGE